VFENRISYTAYIHDEVKNWVCENISRWELEKPDWYKVESIPDEFLPEDVFDRIGGKTRRRKSVTNNESRKESSRRVHPG